MVEDDTRLYERAAPFVSASDGAPLPIWHLDRGWALFIGCLGYNAPHAHSVPVYLAGVYAPFRLRISDGAWSWCRAAAVPAGVSYEFDCEGRPLAVLYLEPSVAGFGALAALVGAPRLEGGGLIGAGGEIAVIREIYEAGACADWIGAAIDSLLAFSIPRAARGLDPRVACAVASLSAGAADAAGAGEAARAVGLSSSRFQHLFAREVGVPFRRFRVWQRLRLAIGEIADGSNFTAAAHAAGFADQAHFARAFRRAFGAPASPSLRRVRKV